MKIKNFIWNIIFGMVYIYVLVVVVKGWELAVAASLVDLVCMQNGSCTFRLKQYDSTFNMLHVLGRIVAKYIGPKWWF